MKPPYGVIENLLIEMKYRPPSVIQQAKGLMDRAYSAGYEQAAIDALARIEKNEKKLTVRKQPWEILTCPRCDSFKVSMIQNEVNGVTEKSYDCQNCGCGWDIL